MSCYGESKEVGMIFLILSGLSSIGSLVVILICIIGKILDDITSRIVVYMSINDLVRSLALLVPYYISADGLYCAICGYLVIYTFISNVVWAVSIAVTLYQVIILKDYDYEPSHKYWLIFAYPILGIIEAAPFFTYSFGSDGNICTLKDNFIGNIWRFTLLYVPYWIACAIIIYAFIKVYLKQKTIQGGKVAEDLIMRRGYIYPLIMMLLILLLSILRIIQLFGQWCELERFGSSVDYMLATHGLLNSIAFLLNKSVRSVLRKKCGFRHQSKSDVGINLVFE